jgi:hypothetical protein
LKYVYLLLLIGCATNPWKVRFEEAMNENIQDESRWKLQKNVITFKGSLVRGDCNKFKSVLEDSTNRMVVNSQGGSVEDGICIGQEMVRRKFEEVTVDGVCLSSCANYLFLGATKKIIKKGIVGYHGNLNALLDLDSTLRPQYKILAQEERNFLKSVKVRQRFFRVTQQESKGMKNNQNYMFLLPLPKTFLEYGITGVEGVQDPKLVWELQNKWEANLLIR